MPEATKNWPRPPRRRIYLLRHGEVDYFDPQHGTPLRPATVTLNDSGREQAAAAGAALAGVPFDRAITSGLARAVQTAERALTGLTLPFEIDPRWREIETGPIKDWGRATPEEIEQVILGALHPELKADDCFLRGETFDSMSIRVCSAWADLLARRDWNTVLIVAHGLVNRFLLCHLLGAGLGGMCGVEQDAGCINLIEVDEVGRALVRLVNFTPLHPAKGGLVLSTVEGLYAQFLRGRANPKIPPPTGA